ncbi:metalloendopeptidase OMA1, mitochondrial-like [Convolutriloba macropyga]|uniref:metalloendopeptidase OMA1, mitochondrial-like n=1 Tax=Convolutriloba macropyga TaxID=536237 RepID=UPI003F527456
MIQSFLRNSSRHGKSIVLRKPTISYNAKRTVVNPMLGPIINFSGRILAAVTGRFVRRKLKSLPEHEQQKYKRSLWRAFGIIVGVSGTFMAFSALRSRDRVLFTGRKRHLSVSDSQMQQVAQLAEKEVLEKSNGHIFPTNSSIHKLIETTAAKILRANRDLESVQNINWQLTVVHSKEPNAFVLPNGHIFVFSGMVNEFVQNEHQLAFILAHEIAHVLLKHSAEKSSKLDWSISFNFFSTLLLFAGFGDLTAFLFSSITSYLYKLALEQPYSRLMENEADEVGLMLIAKACYDIREACALWKLVSMKVQVENFGGGKEVGHFFSTHPSFETRANNVEASIEKANHVRASRHCAPLNSPDPVQSVEKLKKDLKALGPVSPGTKIEILKDQKPGRKAIKLYHV